MKRKMMTAMILGALFAASLTGCGGNVSQSSMPAADKTTVSMSDSAETAAVGQNTDSTPASGTDTGLNAAQTTTAASQTTAAATKKAAQTTAATDSAPPVLGDAQMKDISKKLIQEYVSLYDGMIAGAVQVDDSDLYQPDSAYSYYRVTDSRYQSISGVKAALANTLTGSEYNSTVHGMLEEEHPVYLEQEGKLYALSVGRGDAYSGTWRWDALRFTNVTADSFTVAGQYVHLADTVITQSFDIEKTEDGFRICRISAPEIA